MSLLPYDCERCGVLLRTYSGEHLCRDCADQLGRDTHDPWWGNHRDHPDAEERISLLDLTVQSLGGNRWQVAA